MLKGSHGLGRVVVAARDDADQQQHINYIYASRSHSKMPKMYLQGEPLAPGWLLLFMAHGVTNASACQQSLAAAQQNAA